ncbi:phosphotransferase enzyme family protein [Dongia sedimenti]|uniref:Phosphotransferase n=1 Tax=Dongia sedimenti TaxID=3064282 RepID=A0ABU0YIL6_9PROT|nr:phosphotransferase [Rhodospirillaceae bacterium R-7]
MPNHDALMRSIGQLAEAALPRWGLEGSSLAMINHSENTTYRVTPPQGSNEVGGRPLILRVHRPGYHTVNGIRSELAWMRALQAEGGVPTPQAIPGHDREDVQTVPHPSLSTPRNCVLFEFIEGEEPRQDHDLIEPFKRLGEVTARTHLHSMRWKRPDYFERTVWDLEHSIGSTPNWGPWTEGPDMTPARLPLLTRLVAAMGRRLARYGQGPDRYGLIHADFRLANLLIHQGDIRVIDFDDCGLGWFLYDAGTAVSFFEHKPEVPGLIDAWAEGYRRVRPLSKEDEAELPTFVMLRRMILFAWMGSHAETDLAKQEGPAYAEGTCAMAETYLSRFG